MKERIIDPQFDPDREKKIFKMYVSIPEEEEERLPAKKNKTVLGGRAGGAAGSERKSRTSAV